MKNLSEKHEGAFTLMFYYSTLKMLIPEDNEDFHDMIYDIEKIKMLRLKEHTKAISVIREIQTDLNSEGFEEIMSVRHEGNDMIIYIKERKGIPHGAFFLMEEDSSLTVLDLVGKIPIDKLFTLSNEIDMLTGARKNFLEID